MRRDSATTQSVPGTTVSAPVPREAERPWAAQPAVGKVLYGSIFVVALPLVLVAWTALLDRSIDWPVPHWPLQAAALIVAGAALMLGAMLQLRVQGHGPPM